MHRHIILKYRLLLIILFTILLICINKIMINYSSNKHVEIRNNENISNYNNYDYFANHGFSENDVNMIYNKLNDNQIKFIINNNYDKNIMNYANINYFEFNNLDRYISYKDKNNNLGYDNIVTDVNIGLDNEFYTNVYNISENDANKIDVLVNKYHRLNDTFIPNNLILLETKYSLKGQYLKKDAYDAFIKMVNDARAENIYFYLGSGYRSYAYQQWLYNKYVIDNTVDIADRFSARAGFSEHQTGLALDLVNKSFNFINHDDIEYSWLINNSYKYGFVLRYPKNKEKITGYMFESWHFRYLGKNLAKILHDDDITYEEYIAKNKHN